MAELTTFVPRVGLVLHGIGEQHFAWHEAASPQTSALTRGLVSEPSAQENAEHNCLHVYAAAGGCKVPELHV